MRRQKEKGRSEEERRLRDMYSDGRQASVKTTRANRSRLSGLSGETKTNTGERYVQEKKGEGERSAGNKKQVWKQRRQREERKPKSRVSRRRVSCV
jgi:hypothetical protein